MSYLVSLQFVIPGIAALLAQVAPAIADVWRVSFTVASVVGIWAILALTPALSRAGAQSVARVLTFVAVPLYALVVVLSGLANMVDPAMTLSALQIEGILFCLVTLAGAQVAWAAAVAPALRPADVR
ncbi:hypothetical protein ACWEOE_07195 [Amycolatopsis sp. NPDC004368]